MTRAVRACISRPVGADMTDDIGGPWPAADAILGLKQKDGHAELLKGLRVDWPRIKEVYYRGMRPLPAVVRSFNGLRYRDCMGWIVWVNLSAFLVVPLCFDLGKGEAGSDV